MLLVLTTLLVTAAPPTAPATPTAQTTTTAPAVTAPAPQPTTAPTAPAPTPTTRLLAVVGNELEFLELKAPVGTSDDAEVARALAAAMKAELWVLPAAAAATRVTPMRATPQVWNDCGGENGIAVGTAASIDAVLAVHGSPPRSWLTPVTSWTEQQLAAAKQRVRSHVCGAEACSIGVVGSVGRGFARVVRSLPDSSDDELLTFEVVDVVLNGYGEIVEESAHNERDFAAPNQMPVALRDVVGDAAPEVILRNGCVTEVRTLSGATLFTSVNRCCGC